MQFQTSKKKDIKNKERHHTAGSIATHYTELVRSIQTEKKTTLKMQKTEMHTHIAHSMHQKSI